MKFITFTGISKMIFHAVKNDHKPLEFVLINLYKLLCWQYMVDPDLQSTHVNM